MPRRTVPDVRDQRADSTASDPRATARQIREQTLELAAVAKRAGLRDLAYFLEVTSLQAGEDDRRLSNG
jgi:hypothetical protein